MVIGSNVRLINPRSDYELEMNAEGIIESKDERFACVKFSGDRLVMCFLEDLTEYSFNEIEELCKNRDRANLIGRTVKIKESSRYYEQSNGTLGSIVDVESWEYYRDESHAIYVYFMNGVKDFYRASDLEIVEADNISVLLPGQTFVGMHSVYNIVLDNELTERLIEGNYDFYLPKIATTTLKDGYMVIHDRLREGEGNIEDIYVYRNKGNGELIYSTSDKRNIDDLAIKRGMNLEHIFTINDEVREYMLKFCNK